MKKIKIQAKAILSITVCVVLCIIFLACNQPGWELKDGVLTIFSDTGMDDWFSFLDEHGEAVSLIKTVKLKRGVTVVPLGVFECYEHLEEVFMADSVHTIEKYAFAHCDSLKTVHWSRGLKSIGLRAFKGTGLTEVKLPNGLKELRQRPIMRVFAA